jgi:DNA topoisomerase I
MAEKQSAGENPEEPASGAPGRRVRPPRPSRLQVLAKRLGLHLVTTEALTISRRRRGKGFAYFRPDGSQIRNKQEIQRLASLAVPPAYHDVRHAEDSSAHLQAVGRDDDGRLQYRYHAAWEQVREMQKARRLERLVDVLPKIRRSIAQHLASTEVSREMALAAVIELVARSGIRTGTESYARIRGTRGAATLLKSNVSMGKGTVSLCFRAKGGKQIRKEFDAPRLAEAVEMLCKLPGRRLFQYRNGDGVVRTVTAREVNAFLREIAGVKISLKDFRTLLASAAVLETLARQAPAASARARRRQVLEAVREVAEDLHNTPTVCRRSYVHDTVVSAFEDGVLESFADVLKNNRSALRREQLLAKVVAIASDSAQGKTPGEGPA